MDYKRVSGILLHPTSLPGPYGIGDLGPEAYNWIDFLRDSGNGLWQILPLGPTGYADSPYQCFSAFAGNPYLISPERLVADGLLKKDDIQDRPPFNEDQVEYGKVIPWKLGLLKKAYKNYKRSGTLEVEYEYFQEKHQSWLHDFALFMALKDAHDLKAWVKWEASLRSRLPKAVRSAREKYTDFIEEHSFNQFIFFRQWEELREYAIQNNIQIIGDVPIYVAHDSADVWSNPDLFYLDELGNPTIVAGVPPDYFTKDGQLWGNPIYRWDVQRENGFQWWIKRMQMVLSMVDYVRLDHFRGFAGYWEVPGNEETARNGRWVTGPGEDLFRALKDALGDLPILAEDLGEITPDVYELRDKFDLPGMKILQFGFDGDANHPFLPDNYPINCVAYTGTHDNDTVVGWYQKTKEEYREGARQYLSVDGSDIAWDMIRAIWASRARMVLAPMQDVLSLDNQARMNTPGVIGGNWSWRMKTEDVNEDLAHKLLRLNKDCDRNIDR